MKIRDNNFRKFVFSSLCIAIPLLFAIIVVNIMMDRKMEELENREMQAQLEDSAKVFANIYDNYYDESLLLADRMELSPFYVMGNPLDTYKAVETLKIKEYFDSNISSVVLDYGADTVYSSSGTSRKRTYFLSILNDNEPSIQKGLDIFEQKENMVNILYNSERLGYVIYSYCPPNVGWEFAAHFLISFSDFTNLFYIQADKQWYRITPKDGSSVAFGYGESGKREVLSSEEIEKRISGTKYCKQLKYLESYGVTIELYYEKGGFSFENGLSQMQFFNIFLVMAAITLTVCISWVQSSRRINGILRLEKMAQEGRKWKSPKNTAFNKLENIILSGMERMETMELSMRDNMSAMKKNRIHMLFSGAIKTKETMELVFRELGYEDCPQRYFMGGICVDGKIPDEMLTPHLAGCLTFHMPYGRYNILFFLYDLRLMDGNTFSRKKIVLEMKENLQLRGIKNVRIGISRIYTDLFMIEFAYDEAFNALKFLIKDKENDYICWDDIVRTIPYFIPDGSYIEKFSMALNEKDIAGAKKCLHYVLDNSENNQYSPENQKYNKYTILHCMIQYLYENADGENDEYIKECLFAMNIKDRKQFERVVMGLLKCCLENKERDSFSTMLMFVENNFQRADLTYEEVAAQGGVTKTYVSKVFRANLGMSYVEYLTNLRMEKAVELLRTTEMSINDIANAVGYLEASGFRRAFMKRFGVGAAEYRKNSRSL